MKWFQKIGKGWNSLLKRTGFRPKDLLCGIGQSEIRRHDIRIREYPFKPSSVYPQRTILPHDIQAMSLDFGVCKIHLADDIVFISAEQKDELRQFASRYGIPLIPQSWNWDWILEPYLDTEFTAENEARVQELLQKNGIEKEELDRIRAEVAQQMYAYNFDTLLWDWCSLGLSDVLAAMRAKYNEAEFRDFYKRALEIETRGYPVSEE